MATPVVAGLGKLVRMWAMKHGRGLVLAALAGAPLLVLSHWLHGMTAILVSLLAWVLLTVLPGAMVLGFAFLTAEASNRRPAGVHPRTWRAARLAASACSGAIGMLWIAACVVMAPLHGPRDLHGVPTALALGAVLGIVLHVMWSVMGRR